MTASRIALPSSSPMTATSAPNTDDCARRAGELGIAENVEFLGYRDEETVRALLGETDVFVIEQHSLEYYDKAGRLRWEYERASEADFAKTITVRYEDEKAHIAFSHRTHHIPTTQGVPS